MLLIPNTLPPSSPAGDGGWKIDNALIDLIDVLIVVAIGFAIIVMALPPAYGGLRK